MKKTTVFTVFILCISISTPSFAFDWQSLFGKIGINKDTSINDTKMASGIKEALRVSIDRSIDLVGQTNGYFGRDAIKITVPEKIRLLETGLRKIGLGNQVDEFILSMNRAAEKAAPYARDIFIESIADMSIRDAESIVKGNETAATQYFEKTTRDDLMNVFNPLIKKSMNDYGVTQKYQGLISKFKQIPFMKNQNFLDIEPYVSSKALDGLYYVMAEEEKEIRTNPKARVTSLLKDVFSGDR